MSQRLSTGIFIDDPLVGQPTGTEIKFIQTTVLPKHSEKAVWVEDWESSGGILLSIQFKGPNGHQVEGSAVLVAPGVAICATHVVQPHIESLLAGDTATLCGGITEHGLQLWKVVKITLVANTDFTILGLKLCSALPEDKTFYVCRLTTRVPAIGERVTVLGFRSSTPFEQEDGRYTCTGNVLMCQGEVTARFDDYRDRVFMPWPAFEIDCPSWGGMSGGPVFDKNGYLIGLLTSSFELEDANGPSFASPIWRVLPAQFEAVWPGGIHPEGKTSLLEADPRLCVIERREAVTVIPGEGDAGTIRYEVWE